uniref:F-box domain-containing protein n=1 Tax=Kalanchoe fedtschenkoi TaxID=63787 RepID=A0A7N0TR00_KALFE
MRIEEESPIYGLPRDSLHQIFSSLPLKQITICKSVSKFFYNTLTSRSFVHLVLNNYNKTPPLKFLALRHSHHHHLHAFDPDSHRWFSFDLAFLPFRSPSPVASSLGLVYLWADSLQSPSSKSLVVCNPITRSYRVLPHLGSAWSRHGSVLVTHPHRVLVLSELATLYLSTTLDHWLNFSSNLPSKPRSPIFVRGSLYALCDVGSPWRSQWKLYFCTLTTKPPLSSQSWSRLEMNKWGDVFDVLKRPRLIPGTDNNLLMVGALKSSFALHAPCSAIVILKLDLDTLEWSEAARMPADMFGCFQESSKFKVFGGGNRVCFAGKRVGKLALWQAGEEGIKDDLWQWIEGLPGNGEGMSRGFIFEASLYDLP